MFSHINNKQKNVDIYPDFLQLFTLLKVSTLFRKLISYSLSMMNSFTENFISHGGIKFTNL